MKYLLFYLSVLVLISCDPDKKDKVTICASGKNNYLTYKVVDTLTLKDFEQETLSNIILNQFSNDKFLSLYKNKVINVFDIDNGNLVHQYNISNLHFHIMDYFISEDSAIYLATEEPQLLLNIRNNNCDTLIGNNKNDYIIAAALTGCRLQVQDNNNLIVYYLDLKEAKDSKVSTTVLSQFDLSKNPPSIQYQFCEPPAIFKKYYYSIGQYPSKAETDSFCLIAYSCEHFIRKYSIKDGKFLNTYCAKSQFVNEEIEGIPVDEPFEQNKYSKNMITNAYYLGIYYDKYRKQFYRIVKHRQEFKATDTKLNKLEDCEWSVIVLDSNLNLMAEVNMTPNIFQPFGCFAGPKGFYVPLKKEGKGNIKYVIVNFKKNNEDT